MFPTSVVITGPVPDSPCSAALVLAQFYAAWPRGYWNANPFILGQHSRDDAEVDDALRIMVCPAWPFCEPTVMGCRIFSEDEGWYAPVELLDLFNRRLAARQ